MERLSSNSKISVNLFDIVAAIARVVDLMSPVVGNHHMQVAYLAFRLGQELGLSQKKQYALATAGALHDIGAFSLKERLDLLEFEDKHPGQHSMAGYLLLKDFKPFSSIARIIKFHHVPWEQGSGAMHNGEAVPPESHLIHLADRLAVNFIKEKPALSQVRGICKTIRKAKNIIFMPEHVDAVSNISRCDYVWLELTSGSVESIIRRELIDLAETLDINGLLDFAWLLCRLVDFKSEFTATHSSGVAAIAVALAKRKKFTRYKLKLIELAACLHDLGKLAIPNEILEKPGKLNEDEWCIMRSHVFHTHQILEPLVNLKTITAWGALHQERLNGKGYPFGYGASELPLGSRIMAVADVFTALTEDRPYRKGLNRQSTLNIMKSMAHRGEIDSGLVNIFADDFDEMNLIRDAAQKKTSKAYGRFHATLRQ